MFVLLLGYYLGQVFKLPFPLWLFQPIAAVILLGAMTVAVLRFDKSPTPDPAGLVSWLYWVGVDAVPSYGVVGLA